MRYRVCSEKIQSKNWESLCDRKDCPGLWAEQQQLQMYVMVEMPRYVTNPMRLKYRWRKPNNSSRSCRVKQQASDRLGLRRSRHSTDICIPSLVRD